MRTVCLSIFVFGLTVSVIVPCGTLSAQPTIPKAKIPADLPADLRQKILNLFSSDSFERGRAIRALVPHHRPGPQAKPAIPFLAAMLWDNVDSGLKAGYRVRGIKFPVGDAAAEALAWVGGESVKPLIQALEDSNVDIRRRAARALGRIGDRRATEPLARLLGDKNGEVRYEAAGALSWIRDPKAAKALVAALGDNHVPYGGKREIVGDIGKTAAHGLVRIGKPAVAGLIDGLKSKDPKVRGRAAWALGRIRDTSAAKPLAALLKDSDVEVRREAAEALVPISSRKTLDVALAALRDNDPQVRGHAAAIFSIHVNNQDKKLIDPLILALGDSSATVRASVCWALWKFNDPRVVKPLMQVLTDDDPTIRQNAANALGKLRARPAGGLLLNRLPDNDKHVRRSAAYALGEIGDRRAIAPLKVMLAIDKWVYARQSALRSLVKLATPNETIEPLVAALNDPNGLVHFEAYEALVRIGKPAVGPVLKAVAFPRWTARVYAARILGRIKDRRAVDPLIGLLSDKKPDVRKAAAKALAQITGQDFGQDAEKWRKWWKTQPTDPAKQ